MTTDGKCFIIFSVTCAGVAKSADARDLKSLGSNTVPVQVRSPAPRDTLSGIPIFLKAGVMELADVPDSKSGPGNRVRVRPPPPAPKKHTFVV